MYNVEQYITVEKCSREGDVSLQIREEVIERRNYNKNADI